MAIGILLAKTLRPMQHDPAACLRGGSGVLHDAHALQAVLQCIPHDEEREILQSFVASGGNMMQLSDAERFVWRLGTIPDVKTRVRALLLMLQGSTQLLDVQTKLNTHQAAARQLRNSRAFGSVLAHVLALGNFLNYGNSRVGNARGFRVSNLNKLQVC